VTTIHGFSSPWDSASYKKYNGKAFYVSISDADRSPDLDYIKTIHHGIDIKQFDFQPDPDEYLLFFGRIHWTRDPRSSDIARACSKKLYWRALSRTKAYYDQYVASHIDNDKVVYIGRCRAW
jgi:hypothetical protein